MPNYQYICDNCSNLTDINHSMDEKLDTCPHCETENKMRKMPSLVAIQKNKELNSLLKSTSDKPGTTVKQAITEIGEEVKNEKEVLKNRTFESLFKK